jgi:large subunit ribosomal protein L4
MKSVKVVDKDGKKIGEVEIAEGLASVRVDQQLLNDVIVGYQRNRRHGNASTLSKSGVSASGRKPWRQKGTGRARAGSAASPVWRGGGIAFGPKPRNYARAIPRELRRKALAGALAAKLEEGRIIIVDKIESGSGRTKAMAAWLKKIDADRKPLIVMDSFDNEVEKATRNIAGADTVPRTALNAYVIMAHDKVVISRSDFENLQERVT